MITFKRREKRTVPARANETIKKHYYSLCTDWSFFSLDGLFFSDRFDNETIMERKIEVK